MVPQPSKEACEQNVGNLAAKFAKLGPVHGAIQCAQVDDTTYALIETEMQVFAEGDEPEADEVSLFHLVVDLAVDPNTLDPIDPPLAYMSFTVTRPINDVITALAANSDEEHATLETTSFRIEVTNDTGESQGLVLEGIYRNGYPVAEANTYIIDSGATWELVLSNVASDYVSMGKSVPLALLSVHVAR